MKPHLPLPGRGRKKDSDKKNGKRRKIDFQRAGLAIATILALSILLCVHLLPDRISLKPGSVAPEDIRAHMSVRYRDSYTYEKLRQERADTVQKIYDRITYAQDRSLRNLDSVFSAVTTARGDAAFKTVDEKAAHARAEIKHSQDLEIPLQDLLVLINAPEAMSTDVREVTTRLVKDAMSGDIENDNTVKMGRIRKLVDATAKEELGNTRYAGSAASIAKVLIRPNMMYNSEKTDAEKKSAMASVQPVYGHIRSGELIVAKGQTVTQEHIEKFTALGLRQRKIDFRTALSLAALVSFLVMLVIVYLARYQQPIYKSTRLLAMLALVVVFSTLCLKLGGGMLGINLSGLQLAYAGMIFTTAAGMILAVLLNPQVAVLIVAMISAVAGIVMNYELRYATSTLISGLVAIYAVANIRGRGDLGKAFGAIAITNIAITWIMGGLFGDSLSDMAFGSVWAVLVIAFLATSLFWIGTWLLERPFKVTTHVSLLELADTNKPILRRLVVEAPGTYTHSMAVGHLAEAAAKAIGADALFARVASYYHDIGKIRRPHFFVENQRMENVHDKLTPTLSALVITSHINDGLEVAREYKLPETIQDIIVQHHGTSLVAYFYNQASEQLEPSPVLEQQFRYDGPKPQSKEAAIVMLADSVEAASRCLTKPSIPALESMVHRVILEKMQDGQLNESELTFRDIGIVERTFVDALSSAMHARIEYQDSLSAENGNSNGNGDTDQQLTVTASGQSQTGEDRREGSES